MWEKKISTIFLLLFFKQLPTTHFMCRHFPCNPRISDAQSLQASGSFEAWQIYNLGEVWAPLYQYQQTSAMIETWYKSGSVVPHKAKHKILFDAPPAKDWVIGRKNILFVKIILLVYFSVNSIKKIRIVWCPSS